MRRWHRRSRRRRSCRRRRRLRPGTLVPSSATTSATAACVLLPILCSVVFGPSPACLVPLPSLRLGPVACTADAASGVTTASADAYLDDGDSIGISCRGRRRRSAPPLPVLDGLFPRLSLDCAWEVFPLLSTARPSLLLGSDDGGGGGDIIPAAVPAGNDGNVDLNRRLSAFRSLISLRDVNSVLSQPNLVHTRDFQLVKKIIRDGEEWNGMPPDKSMSSEEAVKYFDLGGFSLVVNALQRRWGNVGAVSRTIQEETGAGYVSCNLYATPSVVDRSPPRPGGRGAGNGGGFERDGAPRLVARRSGFESHWDWMDVIVLQISGSKLWSVASEPLAKLSTRDLKRKPTPEEMEDYLAPGGRYREFLMMPGDALYIPRGYVHNASTVGPDAGLVRYNRRDGGGGPAGVDLDADDVDDDGIDDPPWLQPSLHLTFGIEHTCETTYEALLQHAARLFGSTPAGSKTAVPGRWCGDGNYDGGGAGADGGEDLPWHALLSLSISDVARRGCGGKREGHEDIPPYLADSFSGFCATESSDSGKEMDTTIPGLDEWTGIACQLRESVPRGAVWREVASARRQSEGNGGGYNDGGSGSKEGGGEDGGTTAGSNDNDPVRASFSASLTAIRNLSSPRSVASFLRRLHGMAEDGTLGSFCLPVPFEYDVLGCPLKAFDRLTADDMLSALSSFVQFAEDRYDDVLEKFERHLAEDRDEMWRRDDGDLKELGQELEGGGGAERTDTAEGRSIFEKWLLFG